MKKYTLEQLNEMMKKNGGWLDLNGCTGLTALPDNLMVGGLLNLSGCTGLRSEARNLKKDCSEPLTRS